MVKEFDKYIKRRERMVREQIISRGVRDEKVIEAMINVPREKFVPESIRERSFEDCPLPIGEGQTISQPYVVALMTELLKLKGDEKILEIGTGSGYQTAVLANISEKVVTVERIKTLFSNAKKVLLDELNYKNIIPLWADGTLGTSKYGLFDRILITAGAPSVPETLLGLLEDNGLLVAPVGSRYSQRLVIWKRVKNSYQREENIPVAFVPLIGKYGWSS